MIVCPWKDLKRYAAVIPGLEEAIATKPWENAQLEAHREFLDIQYIVKGKEVVGWAPVDTLTPADEFNTAKDKGMYTGKNYPMEIEAGYCYVVYPEDAHAPGTYLEESCEVTKLVIKLKV